jgi:FMN-dependent NADH-azoreductase
MATLLHLDSSPLATSVTRELGQEFEKTWKAAHPDGTVIYRDLASEPLKPVDAGWIYAVYTPPEARTPEQTAALAISDALLEELEQADEYVFGVAMHNFSIPSVFKLWIDQISRVGRTFTYGPEGPKGLLTGKKLTILIASGGNYAPGTPYAAYDFVEPYLKAVFGFIGVTDITVVTAGGTSALMSPTTDRTAFLAPTLETVRTVAA